MEFFTGNRELIRAKAYYCPHTDDIEVVITFTSCAPTDLYDQVGKELLALANKSTLIRRTPPQEILTLGLKQKYIDEDIIRRQKAQSSLEAIQSEINKLKELHVDVTLNSPVFHIPPDWIDVEVTPSGTWSGKYKIQCTKKSSIYQALFPIIQFDE